ncbi:lipocalin family protein [Psychrobacter vallis]|uniref:lipocalin family protein n=1 Tax=Psychrobacter vallis TaxID=248451 RepID=UPI00191B6F51|nr:lipocalin family protein [Psychrobacter vallis]
MKTNKLPQSAWSDSQEAGSQSQQTNQSSSYYMNDGDNQHTGDASNDASYHHEKWNNQDSNHLATITSPQDSCFGYKRPVKAKEFAMTDTQNAKNDILKTHDNDSFDIANGYKQSQNLSEKEPLMSDFSTDSVESLDDAWQDIDASSTSNASYTEIPERIFMNGLIKHTGIALAIIIPLAAFSAYAATPPVNAASGVGVTASATTDKTTTETLSIKPSAIIHKAASTPTTVDSVDLKKYAGTWYEIGRLPMYFQRNCASDVTATYTEKTDGSGIIVANKCMGTDGTSISAEGLAKPVDATGSKLKVTFLPSWIRWLPVGRADYWVLARDADYKTALVGTPDKDYLWLLARSPNVSQETYAKYRQIAQQQGYDLKEFKLTPHSNQTVKLVP